MRGTSDHSAIEPALTEPEISTGELRSRIGEPGLCVVDVRPLFHYNGWSEPGAARGGHIPGAVALPSAWLSRLDESELQELLVDKGITRGRRGRDLRQRRGDVAPP